MGAVKPETPCALMCAVCYREEPDLEKTLAVLKDDFGPIAMAQAPFKFDHTAYYREEMGEPLYKQMVVFEELVPPGFLADIKLLTNDREQSLAHNGRRRINIDPGYIAPARVVLASTKDFAHRIYLSKGIYGEVTLVYQNGRFESLPWTYPDFREDRTIEFLGAARKWYMDKVAGNSEKRR
jgi:hypothetical protein